MVYYLKYIIILLLFAIPANTIGNTNIKIAPFYSYNIYDSQLNYSDSHSFGLNFYFKFSDHFSTSTGISFSDTRKSLDVIGGQSYIDINESKYRINLLYSPIKFSDTFIINFSGGIGVIVLKTGRYKIDIGALGYRYIEPNSSTHFLYSLGLPIETKITSAVNLIVNPEILFFNIDSKVNNNFSISGGLIFDLF